MAATTFTSARPEYSSPRLWGLVVLRVLIGWHFLYEGIAKLLNPYWSSIGLLGEAQGFMAGIYTWIATTPSVLQVVDWLNIWGLIAIGLALMLGVFSRVAAGAGVVLLLLYYLATPPFVGFTYGVPFEGNYLVVNKTLIEAAALAVLWLFPTSHLVGLDRLFVSRKKSKAYAHV